MTADDKKFTIAGNRLIVKGELGPEDEKHYSEALFELLKTGKDIIEVDLTQLHHMSSAYIGSTCLLALVAGQRQRKAIVIARPEVYRVLEVAGLCALTEVIKKE
jgi:anti-anti-sigma regulatory factor